MITLRTENKPYELSILEHVVFTVKPLTTTSWFTCRAAAERRVQELEERQRDDRDLGMLVADAPDLSDEVIRAGLMQVLVIKELARQHVIGWRGVIDEAGNAIPFDVNLLPMLMDVHPVGETFYRLFTVRQTLMAMAKNGSTPSASGTSSQAEGGTTAADADEKGSPAPQADAVATASAAPTGSTPPGST